MIIYCAGPVRGDKQFNSFYKEIVNQVTSAGHTALCELNKKFKSSIPLTDKQIFKRNIKWMESSQFIIAEVSGASTGVGFEVAFALYNFKKPVLALQNKDASTSAMILGCNSDLLSLKTYSTNNDIKKIIAIYLAETEEEKRI